MFGSTLENYVQAQQHKVKNFQTFRWLLAGPLSFLVPTSPCKTGDASKSQRTTYGVSGRFHLVVEAHASAE